MTSIATIAASKSGVAYVNPENSDNVGAVLTSFDRGLPPQHAWTTAGPWTTYSHYQSALDNVLTQSICMALGDGYGNAISTPTFNYLGQSKNSTLRKVLWSNGNRIGRSGEFVNINANSGYSGISWLLLPIRNNNATAVTISLGWIASSEWISGFDGAALFILSPNNTTYSSVTSVSSTSIVSLSSVTSNFNTQTASITLPANRTSIIVSAASDNANVSANGFYNLNTIFTTPGIVCDQRMLTSLATTRFLLSFNTAAVNTSTLAPIWTLTGSIFGDR